jgi:hypothetical protein
MNNVVELEGRRELLAQMQRIGGPRMRALARRVTADAMRPVIATARERAPVASGRLRASLGQLSSVNRRGDAFTNRVGTRRDFVYRNAAGQKVVSGRGKIRDRAVAKGIAQDRRTAQQYGRVIEFGVDRGGRIRRRAGPARFLEGSIQQHRAAIIAGVSSGLRTHLSKP